MTISNYSKPLFSLFFVLLLSKGVSAQYDTVLGVVHFQPGKHMLSTGAKMELANFIDSFKNTKHLIITARCDSHGDNSLNDSLSIKRCVEVLGYLVTNGISPANIDTIIGLGKRSPVDTASPYTDYLNRVAWITVNAGTAIMVHKENTPVAKKTPVLFTDTFIQIFPPYPLRFLTNIVSPHKGDTLLADTAIRQTGDTIFITRRTYIAGDSSRIYATAKVKEIPAGVKPASLTKAFMDTLLNSVAGQAIIIRGLTFEFGYHVLLKKDLPALQAVLTALASLPALRLEIRGHDCCVTKGAADAFDNQTGQYNLSVNRAKEVYDFLIANGISKEKISYAGLSMNQPLVYPETSKLDQYKNRRIEFVILYK